MRNARPWIIGLAVVVALGALGTLVARKLLVESPGGKRSGGPVAAPVEVALVERGWIESRRFFSGALEATARVTIAPKVAGRVISLPVDLADPVKRGQVVARLDSAEFEQAVAQSEAEVAVTRANLVEAESAVAIAQRELDRVRTLNERGIASDSQLDTVQADYLSKQAAVQVAKAHVTRAEAALQSARIRLGYTVIAADWEGGDDQRVVAQRLVEEGDTVAANTPLLSVVELDPIDAVIFATEREYALLSPGQRVTLTTDAYASRRWEGWIARISPVFREGSRQARVEVTVPNPGGDLKPGMFVRVETVLGREEDATIVPVGALVERDGATVVFVVAPDGRSVRMVPVTVGIRDGERVQVTGEGVEGRVVTLGQQLIGDGSPITIPGDEQPGAPGAGAGQRSMGEG